MPRGALLLLLSVLTVRMAGQSLDDLQIHGFATQGFLFSSNNNYLTMRSSAGSLQWTEGALSINDPLSDRLRIGMQLHMFQMGQIGGPDVRIDWASGDYRFGDSLGFRGGKVKLPMGLYNDSQDVDSLFLWVLLPQACYPVDNRDFDLALLGGEVYGEQNLGARRGRVQYRGYYGESSLDANEGYSLQLEEMGVTFNQQPSGRDYGGDVRWISPWRGFLVGSSAQVQRLDGTGDVGSLHMANSFAHAFYAEWKWKKAKFAAEYWRVPIDPVVTVGSEAMPIPIDERSWYVMASYGLAKKLQLGTYYSRYINKAADTSLPENYSNDWAVSERYDFNQYVYSKVEGHFLHGTGLGYYASTNPNGLKPSSAMVAARIGFTF